MIILDDDGLSGVVLTETLRNNGYSEDEYSPGSIIRFEEGNVIFHVYIESTRKSGDPEQEWADFMVYWPG